MMTSGFFRLLPDLPKPVWRYPISFLSFGSWGIQVKNHKHSGIFSQMKYNHEMLYSRIRIDTKRE